MNPLLWYEALLSTPPPYVVLQAWLFALVAVAIYLAVLAADVVVNGTIEAWLRYMYLKPIYREGCVPSKPKGLIHVRPTFGAFHVVSGLVYVLTVYFNQYNLTIVWFGVVVLWLTYIYPSFVPDKPEYIEDVDDRARARAKVLTMELILAVDEVAAFVIATLLFAHFVVLA
jgi:hypothetical protein